MLFNISNENQYKKFIKNDTEIKLKTIKSATLNLNIATDNLKSELEK